MKAKFLFYLLFIISINVKAQTYVTINDTNFVDYLQTNFPSCMSGNQMNTSCSSIQSATYVSVSALNIYDLSGIEYFTSLQALDCSYNILTGLPALPGQLESLECGYNLLTSLPPLPTALCSLSCQNNQLTTLPTLPQNSIDDYGYGFSLNCSNNQLSSLPQLPQMMSVLQCQNNNIACFPTLPYNCYYYGLSGNPFTCLPNHTPAMDASLLAYPICITGDAVNNPNNCQQANGIMGITYKDVNSSCVLELSVDTAINNIPFKVYDSANNLLGTTYTFANGTYQFIYPSGTYRVEMDTIGQPFTANCIYPGLDSLVTIPAGNPLVNGVNFDIGCKPGFDIGVRSVYHNGIVFPGQPHILHVNTGDMMQWFGLNCASGQSGQVVISVIGPVTYTGSGAGSLTPVVAGNVFTYNISDFGTIDNGQAFILNFITNTAAVAGDQVCVNVSVTPVAGDNNVSNNTSNYCYFVVNSYDPNMKEVSPIGNVVPGFQDWLTYTIHFQNTGNAPAINIRLADTLDADLDLSTFQVMNYSHFNTASLSGVALSFNFPNIQLADSTSDPEGSKGFVQYRIKPKANLPAGTFINNTASIYFDFNAPVITNTVTNEFVEPLSVKDAKGAPLFRISPNPGNGIYLIRFDGITSDQVNIEIYNTLGELIIQKREVLSSVEVDLSAFPNGVYHVKVQGSEAVIAKKIIKQ
jgi:uncharacterized repeat protein (TIGR01451 family)